MPFFAPDVKRSELQVLNSYYKFTTDTIYLTSRKSGRYRGYRSHSDY